MHSSYTTPSHRKQQPRHIAGNAATLSMPHHLEPFVGEEIKAFHAAQLTLCAVSAPNDVNARGLGTRRYPLQLATVLLGADRFADEQLALLAGVEELGLEHNVLQEGQVQEGQADVLEDLAGAELPRFGVVANPSAGCFKYLGKWDKTA